MDSVFDIAMKKTNPDFFGTFGTAVSYTPKGGEAVSITAIMGDISEEILDDDTGETTVKFREAEVRLSEIASSSIGDIITDNSVEWVVTEKPTITAGNAVLRCRWSKPKSRHHESHKHKLPA